MSRISNITLLRQAGFHALTVRKTINFMEEFADFAGHAFDKITGYLNSLNEWPGGAPFVCFHNMELERLDVEAGFPVAGPMDGADGITAAAVPAQRVVTAIDSGPYEKQDATLEQMLAWIQSSGWEMQGDIYYHYLNDADRPENELLTQMTIPVK